jgi:anaerobic nitric oxide reductase flavorubredoxin
MPVREIKPGIFWIGVNDRTTDFFEGFWPITQEGVTYNSYLVKGEKTAIIDLAKSVKGDEFLAQIGEVTEVTKIDIIVINHMEPDHTGLLRMFRRLAPQAVILGSAKTRDMLRGFFSITENVRAVADGETLSLGGPTLNFLSTPFLHWPETIMTYEKSQKVLFSCDAFGGYGAVQGGIFDDDCAHPEFYEREALRYYANIVANYSSRVLDAIGKAATLPVEVIAPSHGLVWRRNPLRIVDLYRKWAECASGKTEPAITLIYGSMYGNTERMMNAVAAGISQAGVPLEVFDVARTNVSYILSSLWTNSGVMIGAPTYEVKVFPPMASALTMAVNKRILNRRAAFFGSYGWSGGALKEVKKIIEPAKWELNETLEFIGSPKPEDLKKGEELGRKFAESIKAGR